MRSAGLICGSKRHFYWKCRLLCQHVQSLTCSAIVTQHAIPLTPHNNRYLTFVQTLCAFALIIPCIRKLIIQNSCANGKKTYGCHRLGESSVTHLVLTRAKALAQSSLYEQRERDLWVELLLTPYPALSCISTSCPLVYQSSDSLIL